MTIAYIGLGGNVPSQGGPPAATVGAAVERLSALGRIVSQSSLYSTEPVGYADQPRFVNAVVGLETALSARELLENLLRIERAFGRDRSSGIRNGPRTLDLDILLFGEEVIREPDLEVPHPRLAERAFVLVPLNEVASKQVEGLHQLTVGELLQALQRSSPTQIHAIIPFQSAFWRPGSVSAGRADVARPDSSDSHSHS